MFGLYPTFLKRLTVVVFQKIREVRVYSAFLKFINQISIEFPIRNILLQKFLQTDMIFFDQLIASSVKFGKCFAEFMILIALLLGLDG